MASRPASLAALRSLCHGWRHELGEHVGRGPLGGGGQRRSLGRVHQARRAARGSARCRALEPVEALLALGPQVGQQALALDGLGRVEAFELRCKRMPSTSASRTAPRTPPASFSSSRSRRPCRRPARPRTCAGRCAAAGCRPGPGGPLHAGVQPADGIVEQERGPRRATARWTTVAIVGLRLPACGTSGSAGASARGPSARTSLGVGSGSPAPAARSRPTTASRSRSRRAGRSPDLDLAEPRPPPARRRGPTPRRRRPRPSRGRPVADATSAGGRSGGGRPAPVGARTNARTTAEARSARAARPGGPSTSISLPVAPRPPAAARRAGTFSVQRPSRRPRRSGGGT